MNSPNESTKKLAECLQGDRLDDLDFKQTIKALRDEGLLEECTDQVLTSVLDDLCFDCDEDEEPDLFEFLRAYYADKKGRLEKDNFYVVTEFAVDGDLKRVTEKLNDLIEHKLVLDVTSVDEGNGLTDFYVLTEMADDVDIGYLIKNFREAINLYNDRLREMKMERRLVRLASGDDREAVLLMPIDRAARLFKAGAGHMFECLSEDIEPETPEFVMFGRLDMEEFEEVEQ